MNRLNKALFLTSNLKLWIIGIVLSMILVFIAFFIGFLTYFNKLSTIILSKFNALLDLNVSARAFIAVILIILAGIIILFSIYKIYKFFSNANKDLFENVYLDSTLSKGKKIVTIGGGTGQYTLLNGLKEHTSNITAVVTTMDSAGSSQLLKTEFGVLPPGDLRNCIIALSPFKDDLRMIFNKRFGKNTSLQGHTIGNLLLTRLAQDSDFETAIETMQTLLRCRGKVLPVTLDNVEVIAISKDGQKYFGEHEIDTKGLNIKDIFLNQEAKLNPKVKEAIKDADLIVVGPGSLYSSVIPNLLVNDIVKEIKKSKAKKVYVMNVMTQYPETHGFKALDFIAGIKKYFDPDYILMNNTKVSGDKLKNYAAEKKFFVEPLQTQDKKYICADLINDRVAIRHDSKKLAEAIYRL
ncbi:MAG: uridine diphosphate-N-acetylglucosamine-binding protein YvcK [Candidatus ainarchaeum sp.]|nr:uridine diphosphate-N-acetylglucosamine-binding protein YvcK [Candidatus ainarchaeum sp.]